MPRFLPSTRASGVRLSESGAFGAADRRSPHPDFPFHVEQMSPDGETVEEILAQASNGIVARATYHAAVALPPKELIMLRQNSRVIARSDESASLKMR